LSFDSAQTTTARTVRVLKGIVMSETSVVEIPVRVDRASFHVVEVLPVVRDGTQQFDGVARRPLWQLRVQVVVDGVSMPMRVLLAAWVPPVASVTVEVAFDGLRVRLATIKGRCRPIVRAEGVGVVMADAAA
jgi:hypothetical protein